ncbi:mannose-6-phosphate isomerase, class I [Nocardioides daeguensis]|uniref:Mannose-6-phosphate isomerase, class I n=1 Tax=Nocardioides daeguensis TaxID=908359 RepID=A0ABP6WHT1_9ACTN|nr:mannose-6-phosphate isomerase, class I [Nocardioides daeguensis]MBV6729080.1 mannose-6-phosphate isomerase, class I [Nocardioides daeguensis]MCR1774916.1 mannose-6-phosphate isomerase, class I [Nocardioides daeguensis]
MLALDCPTQSYDWGSADAIPGFQRRPAEGGPVAEVWVGTHPLGTAQYVDRSGARRALTAASGELAFMLKVLAADRPLSIQAHPNAVRARAGFEAEEARGIPVDAPERVFKDPYPKPEMVYALSTFDTLVGFRPTAEILRVLAPLGQATTVSLAKQLRDNPGFAGIVRLVEGLLGAPPAADAVAEIVEQCREALAEGIDIKRAYATAVEIADHFPGDVGVVISLLLNRLTLQPGEAAYLGAGIIHAHLSGMCLEVMVSSDNVLRAGLTSKHVDPEGLVLCLEEGMSRVARVTPQLFGTSTDVFSPTREFALSVTQSSQADPDGVALPHLGQRLLVCTGGDVTLLNARDEALHLHRGDAAYADESDGGLRIVGAGEVAQAYVPSGAAGRLDDLL